MDIDARLSAIEYRITQLDGRREATYFGDVATDLAWAIEGGQLTVTATVKKQVVAGIRERDVRLEDVYGVFGGIDILGEHRYSQPVTLSSKAKRLTGPTSTIGIRLEARDLTKKCQKRYLEYAALEEPMPPVSDKLFRLVAEGITPKTWGKVTWTRSREELLTAIAMRPSGPASEPPGSERRCTLYKNLFTCPVDEFADACREWDEPYEVKPIISS